MGLRTSVVKTRDGIIKILPNSKLVEDTVVNWSHNNRPTRFHVELAVAFGSDLLRVKTLLLQAAGEHPALYTRRSQQCSSGSSVILRWTSGCFSTGMAFYGST